MVATINKSIHLRLLFKSMPETPPTNEPLDIGIQDKAQSVHAGVSTSDGSICFGCNVEVHVDTQTKALDFRGHFVHGTRQARFLYVSWKKRTPNAAPWHWRIKIPLADITSREVSRLKPGEALQADVTARRPHVVEPVSWERVFAGEA